MPFLLSESVSLPNFLLSEPPFLSVSPVFVFFFFLLFHLPSVTLVILSAYQVFKLWADLQNL